MNAASKTADFAEPSRGNALLAATGRFIQGMTYPTLGIALLLGLWWIGGYILEHNPDTEAFAAFGPSYTFQALYQLVVNGSLFETIYASLYRVLLGMFWGIVIGVPVGVAVGYSQTVSQVTNLPFQFLRMISPLAWMPVAVLAFASWDSAIVFLITMATVWPIMFSTAHGVRRIDPNWFKVAKNLGGDGYQMLRFIVMPAIMVDVLAGIRLAVGVAWIVLVPAEYLGVTSGLGYAINDARDTLEYDTLAAIVLVIGVIGYMLDWLCAKAIQYFNWHVES